MQIFTENEKIGSKYKGEPAYRKFPERVSPAQSLNGRIEQGVKEFLRYAKQTIIRVKTKKSLLLSKDFLWCLQESNQGHMDFQSIALPTELRYLLKSEGKYKVILAYAKHNHNNYFYIFW